MNALNALNESDSMNDINISHHIQVHIGDHNKNESK